MTKEEFINKYCYNCGSQRCDQSDEWLESCKYWRDEQNKKE